ncbi:MAG: DoxX family protein [Chthoniobacterales bacterium]
MIRATILVLRLLLGGIFLWAGLSKVGEPMQTLATIYSYQIVLPDALAEFLAMALPWVELLLAVALFAGLFFPWTLLATALVLGAFTALTAQAWWRGLDIDCGCFDFASIHPSLAVLATPGGATVRNLVLLVLTALLAWGWRRTQRQSAA